MTLRGDTMGDYQQKAKDTFDEVCMDKSLVQKVGFERSIPNYVAEWLIDKYFPDGKVTDERITKIRDFVKNHLPPKSQKEVLRNRLLNGEQLTILDDFGVHIDLKSGRRLLTIPGLDIDTAYIERGIVDEFSMLLCGGMWGAGKIAYHPYESAEGGEVWLIDFKPMQAGRIDIEYYCDSRSYFTLDEWRSLLLNSIGYNPDAYTPSQQIHLLTRLIPAIQNRVNLIELAPKGTGKSWTFINLSSHVRLVSGGKVTPAVIFYNNATNTPGLLVKNDVVVLDEAQSISFTNPGEIIGILKGFLEAGYFTRGKQKVTSECSLVMLANILIDSSGKPLETNLFAYLPEFFGETAFIDRLHGILPGWELPKFNTNMIANGMGFKADFFGEVLHVLRDSTGYIEYVKNNCNINTDSIRDKIAIWRFSAGLLKLLFPNLEVSREDFYNYCLEPAIKLRQRIRDQLSLLDSEYKQMTISVDY